MPATFLGARRSLQALPIAGDRRAQLLAEVVERLLRALQAAGSRPFAAVLGIGGSLQADPFERHGPDGLHLGMGSREGGDGPAHVLTRLRGRRFARLDRRQLIPDPGSLKIDRRQLLAEAEGGFFGDWSFAAGSVDHLRQREQRDDRAALRPVPALALAGRGQHRRAQSHGEQDGDRQADQKPAAVRRRSGIRDVGDVGAGHEETFTGAAWRSSR
jgi:hypothetical protein